MIAAEPTRESQLVRTFVRLADCLVTGFDVVELLDGLVDSSVRLLDLAAAGLMLSDQRGGLRVLAASSERTRLLELFEVQNDEGPCRDAFRTGQQVASITADDQRLRWPTFADEIAAAGFGPVYALPMRLRDDTVGAVNLFCSPGSVLSDDTLAVGQALADVATIALLQHRTIRAGERLAEQLQTALTSRIAIEQAKGILAERGGIDMDAAFALLRSAARARQVQLSVLAAALAGGEVSPADVLSPPSRDTS